MKERATRATVETIDHGRLLEAINQGISEAAADVAYRFDLEKPRAVTLKLLITPNMIQNTDGGGVSNVPHIAYTVDVKKPNRVFESYGMIDVNEDTGEQRFLVIENAEQQTMFPEGEE